MRSNAPMNIQRSTLGVFACLILGALTLGGCAGPTSMPTPKAPVEMSAQTLWQMFRQQSTQRTIQAFSLDAVIHYAKQGSGHRLVVDFYGNIKSALRMDLKASVGTVISLWREDGLGVTVVIPEKQEVRRFSNATQAAAAVGMDLPFSLRQLAAILLGQFDEFLPNTAPGAVQTEQGFSYSLPDTSPFSSITLDFTGKAVHLTGHGATTWSAELTPWTSDTPGPAYEKIVVETSDKAKIVLRVRSFSVHQALMPETDLELPVM